MSVKNRTVPVTKTVMHTNRRKDFITNTSSKALPEIINGSISTNRLRKFVLAINGITLMTNYLLPVCWLVLYIKHLKGTHFLREDKTFVWLECAFLSNHYFWTDTEKKLFLKH